MGESFKIMKILVAGTKWHDNLLDVVAFGFKELGHDVEIFNDNIKDNSLFVSKVLARTPLKNEAERLFEKYQDKIGQLLIKKIEEFKPDLIFVVNGFHLNRKTPEKIRKMFRIPVVVYVVDDPLLKRTWLYDLGGYSHLFVIDDSWMPYLEYFNPGNVSFLPQTSNHRVFRLLEIKQDYEIGFSGNLNLKLPNTPSGFLRAQILNYVVEAGYNVIAAAPNISDTFEYFPALKKIKYFDKYVDHEELNRVYNRAKIILSIHSPQFKHGIAPRVFEAAFAGAFQLVEYKPDIETLFPGMPYFKTKEEMLDKIEFYLNNDRDREDIAKKMRELALEKHTFKSRAEVILDTIKNINFVKK